MSDRSLLVEILCLSWSQHSVCSFLDYPAVLPALMGMLSAREDKAAEPAVFQLHLQMIKNLVVHSLQSEERK